MKKFSLSLWTAMMAVVMVAAVHTSPVYAASIPTKEAVTIYGMGKVTVAPDKAMISVSISAHENTSKEANMKMRDQTKHIGDLLKPFGVESKDIQTTWFNMYPQMDYQTGDDGKSKNVITAYDGSRNLNINVHDVSKVNEIMDLLTEDDSIINVTGVNYMLDNKEAAMDQAREMAAKDAMKRVAKLAKLLNIKIGGVVSSEEMSDMYNAYSNSMDPTAIDVTMQLQVSFEIVK